MSSDSVLFFLPPISLKTTFPFPETSRSNPRSEVALSDELAVTPCMDVSDAVVFLESSFENLKVGRKWNRVFPDSFWNSRLVVRELLNDLPETELPDMMSPSSWWVVRNDLVPDMESPYL